MLRSIVCGRRLLAQTCRLNFTVSQLSQKIAFLDLTRLSSQSASSNETQSGELRKKELLDTDAEQQTNIDTRELSDSTGVVGFTDCGFTIPTAETASMLVNGVRYDELPIIHIHSSKNNTIMTVTDHTGDNMVLWSSCGREGFKTAKKGTNVAAQATGLSVGTQMMRKGLRDARVAVKGIGVGRLPSIKGVHMAGVNIVSITDRTTIPHAGPRARKRRRV